MVKKITLTYFFFSLILSIAMIVNLPAHWFYAQFIEQHIEQYPIQVQSPQGTVWSGSTSLASSPDIPLKAYIPKIQWSFQYQQLASMKIIYKIEISNIEALGQKLGSYYAFVGLDLNGYLLQIEDDNAPLSIKAVGQLNTPQKLIVGKINLRQENPELQNLLKSIPQIQPDGNFQIPLQF